MGPIKTKDATTTEVVINKLEGNFGLTRGMQHRIGLLVIAWGMYECNLELLLWAIKGENPAGIKPSTDAKPVSDWINRLRNDSKALHERLANGAAIICDCADDLLTFRNAIVHGWLVPVEVGGPLFLNNPRWFSDRKRPSTEAHISDQLLDMGIECADILLEGVARISASIADQINFESHFPLAILDKLRHAQSMAHEIRYLTSMMNFEKY